MVERGPVTGPKHQHGGTALEHYAALDVSLEWSSVCIVDPNGRIVREPRHGAADARWFRPVHVKAPIVQEIRALLTARKLLVAKLRNVESSIRGILRGFRLKVGPVSKGKFEAPRDAGYPAMDGHRRRRLSHSRLYAVRAA